MRKKVSYICWKRQNDLIDSLAACIMNRVKTKIDDAHFFSVAMNGSFAKSKHKQFTFIIRYVDQKSENVYERLMDVRSISSASGEIRFQTFIVICDSLDLKIKIVYGKSILLLNTFGVMRIGGISKSFMTSLQVVKSVFTFMNH